MPKLIINYTADDTKITSLKITNNGTGELKIYSRVYNVQEYKDYFSGVVGFLLGPSYYYDGSFLIIPPGKTEDLDFYGAGSEIGNVEGKIYLLVNYNGVNEIVTMDYSGEVVEGIKEENGEVNFKMIEKDKTEIVNSDVDQSGAPGKNYSSEDKEATGEKRFFQRISDWFRNLF